MSKIIPCILCGGSLKRLICIRCGAKYKNDNGIFPDKKDSRTLKALDKLATGQTYSKQIGMISTSDFYNNNGSAQLEIICIDPTTYTFTYDLLK